MNKKNHLIAQFMGVVPKEIIGRWMYRDGVFFSTNCATKEEAEKNISNYVKYDSSWDWIMPVFIKLFDIQIDLPNYVSFKLNDALLTTNIEEMYNTAVEILEQHYEQV